MYSHSECQRQLTRTTHRRLILILLGLGLALLLELGPHVQAAPPEPYQVKDIWPGSDPSYPSWMIDVNGMLFFAADDGSSGRELWKSDGMETGTVLVKDIWPGPTLSDPSSLTAVNDTLFFVAVDGSNGMELWKSNGTAAGTVMVKDIKPGGSGLSYSSYLTDVDGTLYFSADDGSSGIELWKSDGTAAGTVLVKDINPGPDGSEPFNLTAVNGTLFFAAYDGSSGIELWKSNGTAAGTVLVKDIYPGGWPDPSYAPWSLTNVNGTLFFSANDGSSGSELWKSDGTESGTARVKDINPGSGDSSPTELTVMNGTFFFKADDGSSGIELWKSDGSEAGTVLVKDIAPGGLGGMAVSSSELTVMNGMLFFWAVEGFSSGSELWRSDGTAAGTVLVKDINPGGSSHPRALTNADGTLYFRANDGSSGEELWRSDGTAAGTVLVYGINPVGDSSPAGLTKLNDLLFFAADDGVAGNELWAVSLHDLADLVLHGGPADQAIHLSWDVQVTLWPTSTWRIAYDGPAGNEPSPITGIVSITRAYTLTGLTNYTWYTVTLDAMLGSTPTLTATARVMPTDHLVYLPLVLRQ